MNCETTNELFGFMPDLPRQLANLVLGFSPQRRKMAEREGFEPPEPCGSAVFKTAAIDHSATSPEPA